MDILKDIKNWAARYNNVPNFITTNKLIKQSDVPTNAYYGSIFLIKGKSIFHFSTVANVSSGINLYPVRTKCMNSIVSLINVQLDDIKQLSNAKELIKKQELELYNDLENIIGFIKVLKQIGFEIYCRV